MKSILRQISYNFGRKYSFFCIPYSSLFALIFFVMPIFSFLKRFSFQLLFLFSLWWHPCKIPLFQSILYLPREWGKVIFSFPHSIGNLSKQQHSKQEFLCSKRGKVALSVTFSTFFPHLIPIKQYVFSPRWGKVENSKILHSYR